MRHTGWIKKNNDADPSFIGAVVAVRDNGSGDVKYYDEADGIGVIALGQGFWVTQLSDFLVGVATGCEST